MIIPLDCLITLCVCDSFVFPFVSSESVGLLQEQDSRKDPAMLYSRLLKWEL